MRHDLDRAMLATAWDETVVVRGVELRLAHPRAAVEGSPGRGGIVRRTAARVRRWLAGAAPRRALVESLNGCFDPPRPDVLASLGVMELAALHEHCTARSAAWLGMVTAAAAPAGTTPAPATSGSTTDVPGRRETLRPGRLPGFLGGGLWGAAYAREMNKSKEANDGR